MFTILSLCVECVADKLCNTVAALILCPEERGEAILFDKTYNKLIIISGIYFRCEGCFMFKIVQTRVWLLLQYHTTIVNITQVVHWHP